MNVSGFSIIRDGVRLGYPFLASMQSVLPSVDEFVIAVGDCSDDTKERIVALNSPKIRIIDTVWDPGICAGGQVMAQQTNLALDECNGDWCFYIQGDEVVHEDDLDLITSAMRKWLPYRSVKGLSFKYLHFMGDYNIRNPLGYRRQVRIIRNREGIRSVGDACGFGIGDQNLNGKCCGARMFHYGYVRPLDEMARKSTQFSYFYRGDDLRSMPPPDLNEVESWEWDLRGCQPYNGSHPATMSSIIANKDWQVDFHFTPWYRNRIWWRGFYRKNFRSLHRLLESRQVKTSKIAASLEPTSPSIGS